MLINIAIVTIAYILGSIPSAVWIGRKFYGVDVREHGSRNAGATNTLRVLGGKAAATVFAMDVIKGLAAVMLGHLAGFEQGSDAYFTFKIVLIFAAIVGHIFPVFAGFKGGKGVATLAGATAGLLPMTTLVCLGIFIVMMGITHYVSVGSMTTGLCLPFVSYFIFGNSSPALIVYTIVVSILLLITHRKNIKRLIEGQETKTFVFTNPKANTK